MPLPPLSPDLMLAVAAAACVGVAVAAALALGARRARAAQLAQQALSTQLSAVAGELAALRHENGAQAATLLALAARFDLLQRDLATDARHAAPATTGTGGSAFELAIRLARGGGSIEELMSACQVTRHEAELALRLHGPQSRGSATRLAAVR